MRSTGYYNNGWSTQYKVRGTEEKAGRGLTYYVSAYEMLSTDKLRYIYDMPYIIIMPSISIHLKII